MKLLLLIVHLQLADTLPPADQLHQALGTFLDRQLEAQLAEFDASKKGNWLHYLPSVGIGYTPIAKGGSDGSFRFNNEPRPTVSFSLSQVLIARHRQRDVRAKRESIAANAALEREKAHGDLDRLLHRHALLLLELETMRRVLDIDRQFFLLIQADYDEAKISPQQFLPRQKALLEAELGVMRKEMEVGNLEGEILSFVHPQ
ncbi:MAG: hypothetical protein H6577_27025 [Lewinellaceae bacterium]|nr:hypothetical protein [Saprospiraceae bacterium]MCB9341796.1 hypothetical protein [Lewinellaceae bacterium]